MKYDTCRWINDLDTSFKVFHELMPHKVWEILLVLSPYDAFIMEEDSSLSTRIINEYRGLNLSRPPRMTRASTAKDALELACSKKFDMVITLPKVGDMDYITLALNIKEIDPDLPVILLSHSQKAILPVAGTNGIKTIDNFFIWSPDPALMLSIIKNVEDHKNVDQDTELAMVRVLILVEDSPLYRSFFLPLLYREVVAQTQAVLDESLNEEHRLLKMRARPKILVAENFEEAMSLYHKYQPYVFAIFTDTSFPKKGRQTDNAGLELLHHIRAEMPDLPLLLMSSESINTENARKIPASFIDKNSPTITEEIHHFFLNHLGFGDFVFCNQDGTEIGLARKVQDRYEYIDTIVFTYQHVSVSTGRIKDGANSWSNFSVPTPGWSNSFKVTNTASMEVDELRVYPNPVTNGLIYFNQVTSVKLYNQLGILVKESMKALHLNVSSLPAGLYYLKTEQGEDFLVVIN